jgi:hypothetical protein
MYSFMVAYELLHLQFQFMDLGKVIVVGVDPSRLRPPWKSSSAAQQSIYDQTRCTTCGLLRILRRSMI